MLSFFVTSHMLGWAWNCVQIQPVHWTQGWVSHIGCVLWYRFTMDLTSTQHVHFHPWFWAQWMCLIHIWAWALSLAQRRKQLMHDNQDTLCMIKVRSVGYYPPNGPYHGSCGPWLKIHSNEPMQKSLQLSGSHITCSCMHRLSSFTQLRKLQSPFQNSALAMEPIHESSCTHQIQRCKRTLAFHMHAWCNALIMQRKEENDGLFYR